MIVILTDRGSILEPRFVPIIGNQLGWTEWSYKIWRKRPVSRWHLNSIIETIPGKMINVEYSMQSYRHLFHLNVEKFVFLDSMNDFNRIRINPGVMNKWAIFESMAKKRTINQRVQMRRSRSQLFLSSFFLFLSQLVKFMESKAKYLSTSPILSVLDWPLSTILTVNF